MLEEQPVPRRVRRELHRARLLEQRGPEAILELVFQALLELRELETAFL